MEMVSSISKVVKESIRLYIGWNGPQKVFYAPIGVNPVGGCRGAVKGWRFEGEIHLLSRKFDQVPLLGGRDILFVCIVTFIRMVYV